MGENKREATIYGAGMSGLIAAANLAREGYSVTVHDREPGYGGSQMYNPSTHVTPIDPVKTSEYIGIDITGAFHQVARPIPVSYTHLRAHETRHDLVCRLLLEKKKNKRKT